MEISLMHADISADFDLKFSFHLQSLLIIFDRNLTAQIMSKEMLSFNIACFIPAPSCRDDIIIVTQEKAFLFDLKHTFSHQMHELKITH